MAKAKAAPTVAEVTAEALAAAQQAAEAKAAEKAELAQKAQATLKAAYDSMHEAQLKMGFQFINVAMPTDEFIALRGYDANRDVDRIKADRNEHLRGSITSQNQFDVIAVYTTAESNPKNFKEGEAFQKLDGHSRSAAWEAEKLTKPEYVMVKITFGLDDNQIEHEYQVLTVGLDHATNKEQQQHFNKVAKFEPKSPFCAASWKTAFSILKCDYEGGLKQYQSVIMLVDAWNIEPKKIKGHEKCFTSGIKAAILDTYSEESKQEWESFWCNFLKGEEPTEQAKNLQEYALNCEIKKNRKITEIVTAGAKYDNAMFDRACEMFEAATAPAEQEQAA